MFRARIKRGQVAIKRTDGDGGNSSRVEGKIPIGKVQDIGYMKETFAPGAFDGAIKRVKLTFNHGRSLANTASGLKVWNDNDYLYFDGEVIDTSVGMDALKELQTGLIEGASFALTIERKEVQEDDDGDRVVVYTKVRNLEDVSLVNDPAYTDTEVLQRNKEPKYLMEGSVNKEKDITLPHWESVRELLLKE